MVDPVRWCVLAVAMSSNGIWSGAAVVADYLGWTPSPTTYGAAQAGS